MDERILLGVLVFGLVFGLGLIGLMCVEFWALSVFLPFPGK